MKKHLTFIDMFAGIGGFRSGMEQAGHKCVGFIEWDKYARKSYQAIYDTKGIYNAKDIQTVSGTDLPDANVWCFGSPCQDISLAGQRAGLEKGKKSSMFFEVIRLLEERIKNKETVPSYLIMENVKNLLSSNDGRDFARVQIEMDKTGYDVEWNVFNSAEVVPQNRERVYIVGHLRGASTRKVFPIQRESSRVSQKQSIKVIGNTNKNHYNSQNVLDEKGISSTITATQYKHPIQVGVKNIGLIKGKGSYRSRNSVYSTDGVSPTLTTMQGGGTEPKVLVRPCLTPDREHKRQNGRRFKNKGEPSFTITASDRQGISISVRNGTKKGYTEAYNGDDIDLSYPKSNTRRGRVQKKQSNTLQTSSNLGVVVGKENLRIRKLTPLECWRLQGFTDEQFYKAKNAGVSNSQLYKQAGNAVTVPVVYQVAKRLQID